MTFSVPSIVRGLSVCSVAAALVTAPFWNGAVSLCLLSVVFAVWWWTSPRKVLDRASLAILVWSCMPVFIDVLRQQSPVFEVLGGDRVAWGSLWWIVLGIGAVILRQRIEQIPFVVAGLQIGATLLSLVVWWHPGEGSVLWVLGLLVMQAMLLPWWYRTLTLAAERRRLCVVGWVSLVGLSGNLLFFLDQNVLWGLWMVISVGLWFLPVTRFWHRVAVGSTIAVAVVWLVALFVRTAPALVTWSFPKTAETLLEASGEPIRLLIGGGLLVLRDRFVDTPIVLSSVIDQGASWVMSFAAWYGVVGICWLLLGGWWVWKKSGRHGRYALCVWFLFSLCYPIPAPILLFPLMIFLADEMKPLKRQLRSLRIAVPAVIVVCGVLGVVELSGVSLARSGNDLSPREQRALSLHSGLFALYAQNTAPFVTGEIPSVERLAHKKQLATTLAEAASVDRVAGRTAITLFRELIPFVDGVFASADLVHQQEITRFPDSISAHEERLETALLEQRIRLDRAGNEVKSVQQVIETAANDLLRLSSHHLFGRFELAALYARTDRLVEAEGILRDLVADTPSDAGVWFQYGVVLQALRRYPAAESAFRQSIRLVPGWANAHWLLVEVLEAQGKKGEALEALKPLERLSPGAAEIEGKRKALSSS